MCDFLFFVLFATATPVFICVSIYVRMRTYGCSTLYSHEYLFRFYNVNLCRFAPLKDWVCVRAHARVDHLTRLCYIEYYCSLSLSFFPCALVLVYRIFISPLLLFLNGHQQYIYIYYTHYTRLSEFDKMKLYHSEWWSWWWSDPFWSIYSLCNQFQFMCARKNKFDSRHLIVCPQRVKIFWV